MRTPRGLRLTLKEFESARITLPDGRECRVYVTHKGRNSNYADLVFDFPKDCRIARETEKTERRGTEDRNPYNREDLKERYCYWGYPIEGKCMNEDCNEHKF